MKNESLKLLIVYLILLLIFSCKSGNQITSNELIEFKEDFEIISDVFSSNLAKSLSTEVITEIMKDEKAYIDGKKYFNNAEINGRSIVTVKPFLIVKGAIANVRIDINFKFEDFENKKYSLANNSNLKLYMELTMNIMNNKVTDSHFTCNGSLYYLGSKSGKCDMNLKLDDFFKQGIDAKNIYTYMKGYFIVNGKKIDVSEFIKLNNDAKV